MFQGQTLIQLIGADPGTRITRLRGCCSKRSSVRYTMAHRNCETASPSTRTKSNDAPVLMQRMNELSDTNSIPYRSTVFTSMPGALSWMMQPHAFSALFQNDIGTTYKGQGVTDFVPINSLKRDDDTQLAWHTAHGCSGRETRWHQQGPSTMHWQGFRKTIKHSLSLPPPSSIRPNARWWSQCGRWKGRHLHVKKDLGSKRTEILKAMRFLFVVCAIVTMHLAQPI